MPPHRLRATIETTNDDAINGRDAFGRGATVYQRGRGDPAVRPNPCIGPLDKPPFFAVRIRPGDLGTYHGIATDAHTRVLDVAGFPIPGLFAVGNDAASVFGGAYPGAGATLGPAMTFGYLCGRRLGEGALTSAR